MSARRTWIRFVNTEKVRKHLKNGRICGIAYGTCSAGIWANANAQFVFWWRDFVSLFFPIIFMSFQFDINPNHVHFINRNIKKTRENFEYRVTQPSRSLKDFLEYIRYERKLISLTKERVQLNKITTNNTIAVMIASRMKQLYLQAVTRFSQNTRLWDEYLKFLQQFKFHSDISSTFEQMLQVW